MSDTQIEEKDAFSISNLIEIFKNHWYWFLISVVVCTGLGFVYILCKAPVYQRTAQVLIKDQDYSTATGAMEDFAGLDLFNRTSNLNNELAVMQSPDLMEKVVKELDLNNSFLTDGKFHKKTLYGDSIPVQIELNLPDTTKGVQFRINVDKANKLTLSKFKYGQHKFNEKVECTLGQTVNTPVGEVKILPTAAFNQYKRPFNIYYTHSNTYASALMWTKKLKAAITDKKSSIIELSINDVSVKRADDILNNLIKEYNEDWIADKNRITVNTNEFIQGRLKVLQGELGDVDDDISSYKSANLLPDIAASSGMSMQEASNANVKILDLSNQLYMARYVKNHLSSIGTDKTLPANTGFESQAVASQINEYNKRVLERNNLLAASGPDNPVVKDMDASLNTMKAAIETAIDNDIVTLDKQLRAQEQYEGKAVSRIASNPEQARYLLSVERQQKVKESLYLYLLQKLEENQLSQTYAAYNNRVIVAPNGAPKPASPKKGLILFASFILGLILPYVYYLLRDSMETAIRSRKELDSIKAPIVGEIPMVVKVKKNLFGYISPKKLLKNNKEVAVVAVEKGSRNLTNEAFRILRTNVSMMLDKANNEKVIAVTSLNPGSGKSFISFNLGMAYALKGKRVVVVDCDLRHGSASHYVGNPSTGLSDYLIGAITDAEKIAVPYHNQPNLEVIPIGKIPPNPTELLENGRLRTLVEQLRQDFDIILLDCPPYNLVADTQIINSMVDRTLFVVRIGLFEKVAIPELESIYRDKRLRNLSVVLNGAVAMQSSYYTTKNASHYYVND